MTTRRRLLTFLTIGALAAAGALTQAAVTPARALPDYLSLSATVNGAPTATTAHTEVIEYEVVLNCSEADCVDVVLTDALPPELDRFTVESVGIQSAGIAHAVTWSNASGDLPSAPGAIDAATKLRVAVEGPLTGEAVGMAVGSWFTVRLILKAPANLAPTDPIADQPITFAPSAEAANAAPAQGQASLTVTVEPTVAAGLTKTWAPARATAGDPSAITLTASNRSNAPADTLTLTE
ncbi:MAG: hypothetical protein LBO20_05700, partial [Bifidobacteriaceae bacterium]|nr:hypothetical protein [Bifidobacteriaceae bacterium]